MWALEISDLIFETSQLFQAGPSVATLHVPRGKWRSLSFANDRLLKIKNLFTVVLCNDVASKCVVGDLLTRVWRIARGLHLAADDNIPGKQSNFCPHLYSAVYLPKVVKSEKVNLLATFFKSTWCNLPEPATNITAGDVTSLHKDFFGIVDPVRGSDHQFVSSSPAWNITQHLEE